MSARYRCLLMLLVTMVIWGSTFVVIKRINAQIPPFALAFARVAIGALTLLAAASLRRGGTDVRTWRGLPWGTILTMSFVGVALYYSLFNFSLVHTTAAQGALVQSCIPAMTALVAVVWLRERATALRWAGIGLSVAGVLIVFSGGAQRAAGTSVLGDLLMFATTLCWGLYTALAKRIANFDPLAATAAIIGVGALLLLPLAAFEVAADGLPRLEAGGWAGIVFLGAGASGCAFLFYSAALKHVDASEAGVYTNLIPIVGVISGVLLGEPLAARAVLGGLIVLAGVWLTSRQPSR